MAKLIYGTGDVSFSDVMIEPQYSEVLSRNDVDVSSKLGPLHLDLPVISANMRNITGPDMCIAMAQSGGLGILHRFVPVEQAVRDLQGANIGLAVKAPYGKHPLLGVSVGVKPEDAERCACLIDAGASLICIDVAHGHHIMVRNMIERLRKRYGTDIVIIAGNVATPAGANDLSQWGADIVKVGIGAGSACQTRRTSGVGVPQLQALERIASAHPDIPIISDGGISNIGDVPKALAFSQAVMVASLIAGTTETPGKVYEDGSGGFYKVFGGSASGENKVASGGDNKFVEGSMRQVVFRGHVKYVLERIREGIQMACSFAGTPSLSEFRERAVLRVISSGSASESKYR